jgi:cytidine deaminase
MASLEYVKNLAITKAKQSCCRYKVSAIGLDRLGNVTGSACNQKRFPNKGGSLHAEMALLRKHGKRVKSIIICRVNKHGKLKNIKPCDKCQLVLDTLKIKVYSIEEI